MSDEEFISSFKMGNTQIIRILYDKNLPSIANHVRKNSGTNTEAESILWEAITILWEKIVQNRFELRNGVTVSTYLFSICVNLWRKELRRIGKYTQKEFADPIDDADYNEENERIYTNRQKVIMDCLSKMGINVDRYYSYIILIGFRWRILQKRWATNVSFPEIGPFEIRV